MIEEFEDIRTWKRIRGIGHNAGSDNFVSAVSQFNRVQQEVNEILDAIIKNDMHEARDAVGDSIVTLINLSEILGFNAEEGLEQAFEVIELRKGITTSHGDFVRYKKLSEKDQKWCDKMQGSPGSEYFDPVILNDLEPINFRKDPES